jgi:predicted methyltransferase
MRTARLIAFGFIALGMAGASAYAGLLSPKPPAYLKAAVDDPARPQADVARDADRKPLETMQFAGIHPGQIVVELAPGGGYYTRLLSAAVGPKGKLYAVMSPPKPDAPPNAPVPGAAVRALAAEPHYTNITVSPQRYAELSLPEKADVVWTTQNYHDFHNIPNTDMATINKAVAGVLKSGGTYFVLDHAAEPGSGARDTNTLHRIDKATVIQEVEAAGFKLYRQSDLLANKKDPHTAKVFDDAIRGHTDQFMLRFTKQ